MTHDDRIWSENDTCTKATLKAAQSSWSMHLLMTPHSGVTLTTCVPKSDFDIQNAQKPVWAMKLPLNI